MYKILVDLFKEQQTDGVKKWSFMRFVGAIWFVLADLGSLFLYYIKGVAISPEISVLTGVILLGVVGGKSVTAIQSAITQINMGGGK